MSSSALGSLRRRWLLLVLVPLAAGGLVYVLSPSSGSSRLVAREAVALNPRQGLEITQMRQASFLVTQPVVAGRAAELYDDGEPDPVAFAGRIRTAIDEESLTITFSASGDDGAEVERYVDAFASAFVEVMNARSTGGASAQKRSLERARDDAEDQLEAFLVANEGALQATPPDADASARREDLQQRVAQLDDQIQTVEIQTAGQPKSYEKLGLSPAARTEADTLSLTGEPLVRGLLAAAAALAAMGAVVIAAERLSPRVYDREQLAGIADAPVLAMVPLAPRGRAPERLTRAGFGGPTAEAYRTLRVNLAFLDGARRSADPADERSTGGSCVAVVSAGPRDGKTSTVASLAVASVEAGADTLVIAADLRRPTVQRRFGLDEGPGLTDLHSGAGLDLGGLVQRDPETGVRLLACGRPTSRGVDVLPDVQRVVDASRSSGQVALIDTAPLLVASETGPMAAMADHVVVVVRSGHTSVRALREAVAMLDLNGTPITGFVLVGSPEASDYSCYYAEYGA